MLEGLTRRLSTRKWHAIIYFFFRLRPSARVMSSAVITPSTRRVFLRLMMGSTPSLSARRSNTMSTG